MSRYRHTQAEVRIRRAMGAMPYGGLVQAHRAPDRVGFRDGMPAPMELDDIAGYLEALVETIKGVATMHDAKERRLNELEHDIAAVRRIFGPKP